MKISGLLIDIHLRKIYPAEITMKGGFIKEIKETKSAQKNYIMPGLIDAHIHIESSMVTPGSFARAAVSRGTTGVVSDPHEIANVMGIEGVMFMIDDSLEVPLKFCFGAPSCVPATNFETNGSVIDHKGVEELLKMEEIKYLAEMMNYPGVIYDDPEVLRKISSAKKFRKPIDGHSPGITGEALRKYVSAGITTDHECTSMEEALEKISLGMKILIREGSAAVNLDALKDLIRIHPDMIMLCSDDLHPEMLEKGHINKIVSKLVSEGYDIFDVLKSCTINPAKHYNLKAGLLQAGDPADFIVVDDPRIMNVMETWIDGKKVFDKGKVLFSYENSKSLNRFNCSSISEKQIQVRETGRKLRIIEAFNGELRTRELIASKWNTGDLTGPDLHNDIIKIVVKDRYNDAPPAVAFIKGFGLKKGAFASSVAHDSHNIICVGAHDDDIVNAVNEVAKMKGGLAVAYGDRTDSLPLPIAGIMSDHPVNEVASAYERLSERVKSFGSRMSAPFMTLSFMALLVIPELKMSDRGLFDGRKFCEVPLFVD